MRAMRAINRTIVSGLIFPNEGLLLMGMKDSQGGGVYADCWHIPGGSVDEGETQERALYREMREEVGIDTNKCKVLRVDDKDQGQSKKILKDTGEEVLCEMQFNVYRIDVRKGANDINLKMSDDLTKLEGVNLK